MMDRKEIAGNAIVIETLRANSATILFNQCGYLHAKIISDGFLTSLGPSFLSAFYRSIATMPQSFLLVAMHEREVVGLIAGSTDAKGLMRRFLLTRAWRFVPHLARFALRRQVLKKMIDVIVYPSKQEFEDLPDAEILNFCVSAEVRGQGLGRRLFEALIKEFEKREIDRIRIVTGSTQLSAQNFYDGVGAMRVGNTNVHEGDRSLVYIYNISKEAKTGA